MCAVGAVVAAPRGQDLLRQVRQDAHERCGRERAVRGSSLVLQHQLN